jgi:predicted GIY-YIG superfamily endonuclease
VTYTYVLLSELDGEWYTGTASDLRLRVKQHAEGRVRSTASRLLSAAFGTISWNGTSSHRS